MNYIISGKNIDVTEGLKNAVYDKLSKLEKYFAEDAVAQVTFSVEKDRQKIEVTIPMKGHIIRAEQVSDDMYVSIDLVLEVIERQVNKHKKKLIDKEQNAAYKEFVNNVKAGDIIVAKKNFGCGSSREHAPIAIKASVVSCVIADTFARIFYRNSINIGLPIIECPEAAEGIEDGDEVEIDFDSGIIYDKTKDTRYKGQAFPPFMQEIIKNEGLINYINNK